MAPSIIDFCYSGTSRSRALAALCAVYPRYSLKRRLAFLANATNILTLHRSPRAFGCVQQALPPFSPRVDGGAIAVLLHHLKQNGRAYAFDFDGRATLTAVTKIATTAEGRQALAREHEILLMLAERALPFQVPQVLNYRDSAQTSVLRMTAAGRDLRVHDKSKGLPSHIFDAIASLRPPEAPSVLPRAAFAWFEAAARRVSNLAIKPIVRAIPPEAPIDVCAAHGDLGSENVLSTAAPLPGSARFAVIDWESFSETRPALTDRVSFWLGQHHRAFKRAICPWDGRASAAHFLSAFSEVRGGAAAAVVALLQLLHLGNDLATRICGATV